MAVFLTVVLTVYTLTNLYIFTRGWQALEGASFLKPWYIGLFGLLFLSYIVGRLLMVVAPGTMSSIMIWLGSFWLAFMLYFFIIVLLLDILRLANHFLPFFPAILTTAWVKTKLIALMASVGLVLLLVVAGTINAYHPRLRTLELTIPKKAGPLTELKIMMASDIHLGTIVGRIRFSRMVETINAQNPDIILLAGDVVDEDIEPVIRLNLGEMLKSLQSRYGTWAIPGNHEYIGGGARAFEYLKEHNVHLLRDSVVLVDSAFYLAGRDDRDRLRFAGEARKSLPELLSGIDPQRPLLLMDHQPFDLNASASAGVDLQLSGHTHRGQLWPLNYITGAVYEKDHGYLKMGSTHFYISCGAGTWGPPIRVGHRPELLCIHLTFQAQPETHLQD